MLGDGIRLFRKRGMAHVIDFNQRDPIRKLSLEFPCILGKRRNILFAPQQKDRDSASGGPPILLLWSWPAIFWTLALVGGMHYGSGIFSAALVSWLADGTLKGMALVMGGAGIGCLAAALWSKSVRTERS